MVTERGIKRDPDLPKKLNTAVFPGLQGGPHDNQTAAIAVALKEASTDDFRQYARQVVLNSRALAEALQARGFDLVSGGTDNHLILVDLQKQRISGKVAAEALDKAGIILNYNLVPYDPMPPMYTSGIRMGTPAMTTRGMKEHDMEKVADWIARAIDRVKGYVLPSEKEARQAMLKRFREEVAEDAELKSIAGEVRAFASAFPLP
jgi:glycine hydroxymethyltransferase